YLVFTFLLLYATNESCAGNRTNNYKKSHGDTQHLGTHSSRGQWSCTSTECYGTCTVYGSGYYATFDNRLYDFEGNCEYILAQVRNKSEIKKRNANFTIYVSNDNCGTKASCPRRIIINFEDQSALVNGQPVAIPYIHNEFVINNKGQYKELYIKQLNASIMFSANEEIFVTLPYKLFANNTRGQCGTCTNNKQDDCMLPDGTVIKDCVRMADSWAVTDTSKPGCIVNKPTTAPKLTTIPTKRPTTKPICTSPLCNLLNSTLFQACHSKIDPSEFIKACTYDNCFSDNPLVKCSSLQRYSRLCSEKGICIDWRKNTPIIHFFSLPSRYSSATNEISHTCNCCRDTETSSKSTMLLCQDGNQISYTYTSIDQCGCMGTTCGLPKSQP
uniref:VWFD domain-containing protein n=1 Tax=Xenopus tropicalis TaxID=8364 RepID=A0A6I8RKH9_XENTR